MAKKKSSELEDIQISLEAKPVQPQAEGVEWRGDKGAPLDHQRILVDRCKDSLVSKNFIIRKDQALKLKIKKKQLKTQGRPRTESEMVIEALESYLDGIEIRDWQDAI